MSTLVYKDIRFDRKSALILFRYHVIPRRLMGVVNGKVELHHILLSIAAKLLKIIPLEVKVGDQWVSVNNVEKLNAAYNDILPETKKEIKTEKDFVTENKNIEIKDTAEEKLDNIIVKETTIENNKSSDDEESFKVVSEEDIVEEPEKNKKSQYSVHIKSNKKNH